MSGINPGLTTRNMLDAGASSATKNTDLTDGIFEDASSDIKSKEQGPVLTSGVQGGMLDAMTGSTGSLGYDAKHQTGLSNIGGSSNSSNGTGPLGSAVEDARKKTQSATDTASQYLKGSANQAAASGNNATSAIGSSARSTTDNASQTQGTLLDTVKDKIGVIFHGSGKTQEENTFAAGASGATKSTDLSDGIHEDAARGIESIKGVTTRQN
ncbi:hypothetical protein LTR84_001729 [Exophiala bonariae]|uniref:CsbD-like domain-containing protein n=1 Tax=Exophiala bonariae TaxID=1690606 RepID=A0AAV9NCH5_9EURO|nr:hypothetical protein LTR84_001729 [Exophiala bonariae]